MIAWFPVLKLAIALLLIWWAWRPIEKHMKAYRERERQALAGDLKLTADDSLFPTQKRAYLPLLIVLVVFVMSPFKITHMESSERTLRSMDPVTVEVPPQIERKLRKEYQAPSNQDVIDAITRKESDQ